MQSTCFILSGIHGAACAVGVQQQQVVLLPLLCARCCCVLCVCCADHMDADDGLHCRAGSYV